VTDARHHYVPQFHLRLFGHGDGNGRIWVYDKQADQIGPRSVKAIASEINYYRVRDGERGHSDELERMFSQLESVAAPLVRRLARMDESETLLSPDERDALSGYVALLWARGPTQRNWTHAMGEFMARIQLDMFVRHPEGFRKRAKDEDPNQSDAEIEEMRTKTIADLESGRMVLEAPIEWGLANLGPAVESIRPILFGMKWRIFRRRRLPFIAIGDCPVLLIAGPDHPPLVGVGFASAGVTVGVPLGPRAILIMSHLPHDGSIPVVDLDRRPAVPSLEPTWSFGVNAQSLMTATRYLFARSQADLEFTRIGLPEKERRRVPTFGVAHVPSQWDYLMPKAMRPDPLTARDDHQEPPGRKRDGVLASALRRFRRAAVPPNEREKPR
jgi:hypothetical protein